MQTYHHASTVIQALVEEDINVKFLVQLDKLIHLLETPTFAYLRLQVCLMNVLLVDETHGRSVLFEVDICITFLVTTSISIYVAMWI